MLKALARRLIPLRIRHLVSILQQAQTLPPEQLAALSASGVNGMHGEPFRFREDGLSCIHNCDFLNDPRFQRAYAAGEQTGSWGGWPLRWRAYVVCWCAEWASLLPGDFVECGVNRGGNARMVMEYVKFVELAKRFLLFDTFKGFAPDHLLLQENHIANKYSYPDCLQDVLKTFAAFSSVSVIAGTVPETLAQDDTHAVAFLSIDMNCTGPEIAAAEHFWPKLVPNGVIILDDYGFSAHIAQKYAFDEFARHKGTSVLSLPTGQGLIFKRA